MLPGMCSAMIAASAGGVVPNAANWDNISGVYSASNAAVVISGISEPIQLRAEISATTVTDASGTLYATVGGVGAGDAAIVDGSMVDFWVSPGASVYFSTTAIGLGAWEVSGTVTVKYKSAGSSTFDQTLDTFTIAHAPL